MTRSRGAELIAAERARQVNEEGWTPEHDAEHADGALRKAAACYLDPTKVGWRRKVVEHAENGGRDRTTVVSNEWPWDVEWFKPSPDPIRNLVKAGALIAAEIDRLSALYPEPETEPATHVDVVRNDWANAVQRRIERIETTTPLDRTGSAYEFDTDVHSDADCPFRESDELPMTRRPWSERYDRKPPEPETETP